jgi:hypothetical protein
MENAQLTIADLASIHSIIDAACTRGAFKAAEMKQVGEIYEKLTTFLQAVKTQAESEADQQTQGE